MTTGAPVIVVAGSAVSGIDFVLDRGGSIQGIVRAADTGLPASAAAVFVWDLQGDFADADGADESGRYEVSGLPPGTYFAIAEPHGFYLPQLFQDLPCPGGSCDPLAGTSISVQRNETTAGIDFEVTPGGLLSGTVTAAQDMKFAVK